jgi:hypothetical protein
VRVTGAAPTMVEVELHVDAVLASDVHATDE